MLSICLSPAHGAPKFRRCIRNAKDEIIAELLFEPGQPLLIEPANIKVVADDVGTALVITKKVLKTKESDKDPDEYMHNPDWEATQLFALAHARACVAASEGIIPPNLNHYHFTLLEENGHVEITEKDPTAAVLDLQEKQASDAPVDSVDPAEDDAVHVSFSNQKDLADAFRVNVAVVKEWIQHGLKKEGSSYNSANVFLWLEENQLLGDNVTEHYDFAVDNYYQVFAKDDELTVYDLSGLPIAFEEKITPENLNDQLEMFLDSLEAASETE